MYMRLKDGKSKVLTLSYDDGVVEDIRLIDIMNKHGLKGTFNISTGLYWPEDKPRQRYYGRMKFSEAQNLYVQSGHEVAVHGLTHPHLESIQPTDVFREILEDRKNIEKQYHVLARGMAYPGGTYSDDLIDSLRKCGICYARTTFATDSFFFPKDWLELHPTCHHNSPNLMELAKQFAEGTFGYPINQMFYLWGHSYEFDNDDNWHVIEEFAEYIGNREDIWYATNIEIYDYVKAYERLQVSVDETIVHNPSAIDVWFLQNDKIYCVKGGETLFTD